MNTHRGGQIPDLGVRVHAKHGWTVPWQFVQNVVVQCFVIQFFGVGRAKTGRQHGAFEYLFLQQHVQIRLGERKRGKEEERKRGKEEERKRGREEERKRGKEEKRKRGKEEERKRGREEKRKRGKGEEIRGKSSRLDVASFEIGWPLIDMECDLGWGVI